MKELVMVEDRYGNDVCFEALVQLMDDETREIVHEELAPCTEQEFYNRYCELHEELFDEEFNIC